MENQIIPTKQGQIVKSLIELDGIDPKEAFLLADNPSLFDENDLVLVYSITEFQRCHAKGEKPFGNKIKLNYLSVIGENMEEWVKSWRDL